ncbi:hypothetical protein E2C01_005673 [Portunus trituberculatus]|uniref:Uncharacterized protein n=1 Tax=Portunus trituberculatus TaxID=210409 RepID=A0A5B7CX87_PORTR|nr:hypothetical protein [Portunus trituberculatus]
MLRLSRIQPFHQRKIFVSRITMTSFITCENIVPVFERQPEQVDIHTILQYIMTTELDLSVLQHSPQLTGNSTHISTRPSELERQHAHRPPLVDSIDLTPTAVPPSTVARALIYDSPRVLSCRPPSLSSSSRHQPPLTVWHSFPCPGSVLHPKKHLPHLASQITDLFSCLLFLSF